KADRVRRMFDAIAPTYELVNHVTSAGRDRAWRRRAVELSGVRPGDRVLDLACGTGDLARAFAADGAHVVGADFAANMLSVASARPMERLCWCRGDALALPFASGAFSLVSCAFGVRNFQNLGAGLREMRRVLRPHGRVVIIEFGMPPGVVLQGAYRFYFQRVLPRLAAWISRDRSGAYDYLPRSVQTFAGDREMLAALRDAGFERAEARRMTFGIAWIYVATRGEEQV